MNSSAVSYFTPSIIDCLEDGKAIMSINNRHYSYWEDSDSDGYNDLIDPFDNDITQWSDRDGDGYGDNPAPATTPDQCPFQAGNATQNNKTGCPDNDGDGYANSDDEFPNDISQWYDTDGDRLGDNWGDTSWNISRQAHWSGQWVLNATNADRFPFDFDNDGFEDSTLSLAISPFDDCMALFGSSSIIKMGCPDTDYDGYPDTNDSFTSDPTQWSDSDDDGFGDNYGNSSWNSSRNQSWPGIWVSGAGSQDACPIISGSSSSDVYGCIDNDGDGYSVYSDYNDSDPNDWIDSDNDSVGDNSDICRFLWGNMTTQSERGCPDYDGDGYSDVNDEFPFEETQWQDTDGDGLGDNWGNSSWNGNRSQSWPGQYIANSIQQDPSPLDYDNDGFEDSILQIKGASGPFDDCTFLYGLSENDLTGCVDSDGDGWSDSGDSHSGDNTQYQDIDNDNYGDNSSGNLPDACPTVRGNSTVDRYGCIDADGDGYSNYTDINDNDSSEWFDVDNDGIGDNTDRCRFLSGNMTAPSKLGCPDSDGDNYSDDDDMFPYDPTEWNDTDYDGIGDNSDWAPIDRAESKDSDGDGVGDNSDVFPNNVNETKDSDGDGMGDNSDVFPNDSGESKDSDGDGVGDNEDDFPTNPNEFKDSDGDGIGDNSDVFDFNPDETADSDGDGIGDNADAFPNDANETLDSDKDGLGDNADNCPLESGSKFTIPTGCPDSDRDGYAQQFDLYPNNPQEWNDTDLDGIGDNSDDCVAVFGNSSEGGIIGCLDSDLDGWADEVDIWPNDAQRWSDLDNDTFTDQLGLVTSDDCPSQPGSSTITMSGCPDMDADGIPDILDPDADGDGIYNTWEYQLGTDPFDPVQVPSDNDGDGEPDSEDEDDDNDGFPDDMELQRGSDPFDASSNPLEEYGGGTFYVPGKGFSSQYDADGIELSFGKLVELLTSEFLAPLILAPISIYFLLSKSRKYKGMGHEIEELNSKQDIEDFEAQLDILIEKNKLKITHALLLRNHLERKQDSLRAKEIVEIMPISTVPPSSAKGVSNNDGYEYLKWPSGSKNQWYRLKDSKQDWEKWV